MREEKEERWNVGNVKRSLGCEASANSGLLLSEGLMTKW